MGSVDVFSGTLVHATNGNPLEILPNRLIGVNHGEIVFIEESSKLEELKRKYDFTTVKHLTKQQFLIPGFIDTHIHASQYPNAGTGLDMELLEWLQSYTFPVEAKYSDLNFARKAYRKTVNCALRNGTTTAVYFATIHVDGTLVLCDVIEEHGQRALVGKVQMDTNSPDYYVEETKTSIDDTARFIEAVLKRQNPLLTPVITPRFAITSTEEGMRGLGDLSKQYDVPIQSHISETRPEIDTVRKLHPEYKSYSDVYDKNGLFTDKTIMAHGVYLTDEELDLVKERGVGISHCPNSNLSIRSGLLDARRLLDRNIKVGLGTDVSGGYAVSMLNAMRFTEQVSNVLCIQRYGQTPPYQPINYKEAFRMATLGGAKVIGMEKQLGNFEVGKYFDALLIDPTVFGPAFDIFDRDTVDDVVQKFFHLGDDRNIREVYVAGRKVLAQQENGTV